MNVQLYEDESKNWLFGSTEYTFKSDEETREIGVWRVELDKFDNVSEQTAQVVKFSPLDKDTKILAIKPDIESATVKVVLFNQTQRKLSIGVVNFNTGLVNLMDSDLDITGFESSLDALFIDGSVQVISS